MNKLLLITTILFSSFCAQATDFNPEDLQGKWLMMKMEAMKVADMNNVWEFKGKQLTTISNGEALTPDEFTIEGDIIKVGRNQIQIMDLDEKTLRAKQDDFIYILEKQ